MDNLTLNDGLTIPRIGFGTYKIKEQMQRCVNTALANGYRLFDTAKVYDNEKELGAALETALKEQNIPREDIRIETKIYIGEKDVEKQVELDIADSLTLLRTSYLDIVLIHFPKSKLSDLQDPGNAERRKLAYKALLKLKGQGLIRSVGVSNYEAKHIEELREFGQMPSINQIEVHPHFTRTELRKYCKDNGIQVQAYSSLARHNETLINCDEMKDICQKYDVQPQHVLLAWAYAQDLAIIPKSASDERIVENMEKTKTVSLTPEDVDKLSSLNINKNYVGCCGWTVS